MFSNLQIRTAKPHHRKSSMAARSGVTKRRVSLVPASATSNVPALSFMEGLFGDEFPEAFASGDIPMRKSGKGILDLPTELLTVICDELSKLDIKRLRLSCKKLALDVDLRLDRVYISPNRANLNCLQRILEHPRYKELVEEIVWDDAQLEDFPTLDSFCRAVNIDERKARRDVENRLEEATYGYADDNPEYHSLESDDFFSKDGRLTDVAKAILLGYDDHFSRDIIARNATVMSLEESYSLYQVLFREEQEVINQQHDVRALQIALKELPNVRRITLTSEVWQPWSLYPDYDTPFYRSLPPGFRKPSIWPWLGRRPQPTPAQIGYREKVMSVQQISWLSSDWRGYGIVISALLRLPSPKIEEFIIDAGSECTGLSYQLFTSLNPELERTTRMLRHIPLKRLEIALNPFGWCGTTVSYLTPGFFKQTLSEMHYLEHLDLNPNFHSRRIYPPDFCEGYFQFRDIIPESVARRLQSFKLRNVNIFEADLFESLTSMRNVQEVTLDNICLTSGHNMSDDVTSWFQLFHQLRSHYSHPFSSVHSTPRYTWSQPFYDGSDNNQRCFLVDNEIHVFLYAGGECPFNDQTSQLNEGVGLVVDDHDKSFRATLRGRTMHDRSEQWFNGS